MTNFFWFTDQALERLQSDGLEEQDARDVIASPLSVVHGRIHNTVVFRGRVHDGRIIKVVLESGYRVVTVYMDKNSQEVKE